MPTKPLNTTNKSEVVLPKPITFSNNMGITSFGSSSKTTSRFYFSKQFALIIAAIIALVAGLFGINSLVNVGSPAGVNLDSNIQVINNLKQLTNIPNEQATITTVTTLEDLVEVPFFNQAQLQDKLVVFSPSDKAILYRPSTNKIINIGTLKQ